MSYLISRGTQKKMKSLFSFALALLMVFQTIGPGVFALKTANATAPQPEDKINICHKGESGTWNALNVNASGWNGHSGHSNDYIYAGPINLNGTPKSNDNQDDAWCASHYNHDNDGDDEDDNDDEEDNASAHISVTKIVCDDESYLPNWGAGNGPDINGTTANTFLADGDNAQHCEKVTNWQFQTIVDSITDYSNDPGRAFTGPAADGWSAPFSGSTNVELPENLNNKTIWVREVLPTGYIPFTYDFDHQINNNDVSAEIYCSTDHLHYDNYENIGALHDDTTYHCVAWNVAVPTPPTEEEPCLVPALVQLGDKIASFGVSPETTLQTILDAAYLPAGSVNAVTSETGIQSWNIPVNTSSVTVDVKLINAIAGNTNELGYYFDGDTSTFVNLFTVPGNTNSIPAVPSVVIPTTGHTSIGFALKSGSTVFATQYTLNSGNEDHAVVYSPVAGTYAVAFEDITPLGSADKDYNDLVAEIKIVSCTHGNQCQPTSGSVVSDTTVTNTTDTAPAVLLTPTHPAWTASIPGASWIWATNPVVAPTNDADLTKVFTKTFTIPGTPTAGNLMIAADNNYSVKVNGNVVPVVFDQNNFQAETQDTYNVLPFLINGVNTIEVTATNWEIGQDADPSANPAGVMFKLDWSSNCGGGNNGNTPTSIVTLHKFIDGEHATAQSAGTTTFSVTTQASWVDGDPTPNDTSGNLTATPILSSENGYTAASHELTNNGNTFNASEVVGGESNILPIDSVCQPGKFQLVGYSYGTTLNEAMNAPKTSGLNLNNISSNQHVIVWNKTCPTTANVVVTKIVCNNEADLPNRGDGVGMPNPPIDATTAANWIGEAHPSCHLESGWNFQWAPEGTANPGDNNMSAGSPWTTSGATAVDGTISINVPVAVNGHYVWVREVPKAGYIPFSGDTSSEGGWNDVSAEIYCNVDVLNYDNYDRVDNMVAGQTYHCVAWNVPTIPDVCPNLEGIQATVPQDMHLNNDGQCVPNDNGGGETKSYATTTIFAADLAADIPAVLLAPTKWFFYNDKTGSIDGAEGINNTIGSFVTGPAGVVLGAGSVQMSSLNEPTCDDGPDTCVRRNLATYQFSNVKLSDIKALRFSTYSQSAGNGSPASERSAYLHFNVSFDGLDTWQRRLVYVPATNGVVVNDTWQEWDAINNGNALWVYSGATWPVTGQPGTTAKTWNQILADYPNIQTRTTDSWLGLRVGEPYADGFTGNVDNFVIAIKTGSNTHTQTFDFEPTTIVTLTDCTENCGGGDNNTPNTPSSFSGGRHRGSVAGASTGAPTVLGASTDLPDLPDTGNGERSQAFMVTLSLFVALLALNTVAVRRMRNS
jgi:hypothetical protein